ncbi:MAG TPA: GNAT family N-acetyltransferase [Vicinamibacterales bacterium]
MTGLQAPGSRLRASVPGVGPLVRNPKPEVPDHLSIEARRDLDLGLEDAVALEALVATRPYVGVFLSPAWLAGFLAEPPDGSEPLLLLMREGGTLRGMVPIAVRRTLTHVRVSLLGGGAGSDRVDLLAARGYEAPCADLFLSWLADSFGRGSVLELQDVPGSSPLWAAIHRAGIERRHRLVLVPREIHPVPYLDLLEPGSRPSGEVTRGSTSLARHRRWLEQRCRLRIERLRDPGEVMSAFETLVRFLCVRWRGHGGSALDDPRAERFHRRVLPLLLAEGRLRMIQLSADMRPIAVYYGLGLGTWAGYYLAGYDREWAGRIHLGQITLATAMDLAAQDGATEFDFLKGAERTKYLWRVRERATVNADVYSAQAGPQALRAIRAVRDAAVALAKTARLLAI